MTGVQTCALPISSFSGLPAGVTGSWSTNVATISGTPTASGTFNYTVTMSGGCTGGTNTASGSVIVNPVLTASVSVVPSTTLICAGSSATFTATPTNGGPTPAYQWKVNGINTGTNSSVFTSASLVNNDVITVVMTSNAAPCLSGSPVTSNPITMTVNPLTTILSQSTSAQAVCLNSSFNPLTVTASGNNITY